MKRDQLYDYFKFIFYNEKLIKQLIGSIRYEFLSRILIILEENLSIDYYQYADLVWDKIEKKQNESISFKTLVDIYFQFHPIETEEEIVKHLTIIFCAFLDSRVHDDDLVASVDRTMTRLLLMKGTEGKVRMDINISLEAAIKEFMLSNFRNNGQES